MSEEFVQITKDELKNFNFDKTFMYEIGDNFYFGEPLTHCLLVSDKNTESNVNFQDYLFDFLKVCSIVENKPSFVFVGKNLDYNKVQITLGGDFYKIREESESEILNEEPCFCVVKSFSGAINNLLLTRYEKDEFIKTFVVIDALEDCDAEKLVPLIKVSHEKGIHFIIHVNNIEEALKKIGKENFKTMEQYCSLRLMCK